MLEILLNTYEGPTIYLYSIYTFKILNSYKTEEAYRSTRECSDNVPIDDMDKSNILHLCVKYSLSSNSAIASAGPLIMDLPVVAGIEFNVQYRELNLNYCEYANIAAQEIAHELGFDLKTISSQKRRGWNFFLGKQTQREQEKQNNTYTYSHFPVVSEDGSHWAPFACFDRERMLPSYDPRSAVDREPLSPLTLAVFEGIGYEVSHSCADPLIVYLLFLK